MKRKLKYLPVLLLLSAISLLPSCQLITDIFKAGYYVGIFVVIAVLVLIYWMLSFFKRR